MKKVIYVSINRLTDRIARDWYINDLIDRGAPVEFWDVVSLMREEHSDGGMIYPPYLRVVRTYRDLARLLTLGANADAYYVLLISPVARFTRLYRMMSVHNCTMLLFAQGELPTLQAPVRGKLLNHALHPIRLFKILGGYAMIAAFRRLGFIRRFAIVFAAGGAMARRDQYALRVVPVNLCDYDNYVRACETEERLIPGRYAVFLDVNFPYTSDLAIYGLPAPDATAYFQSLNRFFDLLERDHLVSVVIAAHPKSMYTEDTFHGRQIWRLRTPVLVRDAEFVITHQSTSLSFAILARKPVIFVYTNEIRSVYTESVMRDIRGQAQYLDAPMYNADAIGEGNEVAIGSINEQRFDSYKYNFVTTHESEHEATADIVWRELNN